MASRPGLSTPPAPLKWLPPSEDGSHPSAGPDPPSLPQGSRLPARTSTNLFDTLQSAPPPNKTPSSPGTSSPQRGLSCSRRRKLKGAGDRARPTHRPAQKRSGAHLAQKWGNPPQEAGHLTQKAGGPATGSGGIWHRKCGNPPQDVWHLIQEAGEPATGSARTHHRKWGHLTQEVGGPTTGCEASGTGSGGTPPQEARHLTQEVGEPTTGSGASDPGSGGTRHRKRGI